MNEEFPPAGAGTAVLDSERPVEEQPPMGEQLNEQPPQAEQQAGGVQPTAPSSESSQPSVMVEDPLGVSEREASRIDDAIDSKKMWGDDTSSLENERAGHQDMIDYLKTRDSMDTRGRVHDAETGKFKKAEQANEHDVAAQIGDTPLDQIPLKGEDGLLDKWAKAEIDKDKTLGIDVEDEIIRRLDGTERSEDAKERIFERLHSQMQQRKAALEGRDVEPSMEIPDDLSGLEAELTSNDQASVIQTGPKVVAEHTVDINHEEDVAAADDTPQLEDASANSVAPQTDQETSSPDSVVQAVEATGTTDSSEEAALPPAGENDLAADTATDETDPEAAGGTVNASDEPLTIHDDVYRFNEGEKIKAEESAESSDEAHKADIQKEIDDLQARLVELQAELGTSNPPGTEIELAEGPVDSPGGELEPAGASNELADPRDIEELKRTAEGELAEKRNSYDAAVLAYAQAKVGAEKMFAGKGRKQRLAEAGEAMKAAYNEFIKADGVTREMAFRLDILGLATSGLAERRTELASLEDNAENADRIAELKAEIQEIEWYQTQARDMEREVNVDAEKQAMKVNTVIELTKAVEDAMLAERQKAHPKMAAINNWLKTHPKTRLAVGLGLTAAGIVGAATFNAPLVSLSVAGGTLLRGYGVYNASRGAGELIANRQLTKRDVQDIDTYLEVSGKQSQTRRISKRVGAGAAALLAAAPVIARLAEGHNILPSHANNTSSSTNNNPSAGPGGVGSAPPAGVTPSLNGIPPVRFLSINPVDGNMLPWSYGMQELHTNISDPAILSKLTNNPFGIKFVGNGLGGGHGAFLNVTIPGQGTFSDVGHINGALAYILNNS